MSICKGPVNVHKKGLTSAVYDVHGRRIITAGSDGKLKIFDSLDDDCPMEHIVGEKINAIACRYENVIAATEGTYVHILQMEDGLPDGVATRFTAEVNHLAINKDLNKLVLCSSDFTVKVVDFTVSEGDREMVFKGHQGAVLSVSFDPLDVFIASSSCDGSVRIWNIMNGKETKCISTLAKCNDPLLTPSYCRLCWENTLGKFLLVPVDKEIRMFERESWSLLCSLTCASVTQPFIVCASSQDGNLVSGGTADGWIIVWRVEDRQAINRIRDPSHSRICSLVWHPHQDRNLLFANENGSVGLVSIPDIQMSSTDALSPSKIAELMGCDEDGDTADLLSAAAAQAESSRFLADDEIANLDVKMDNSDSDSIDLSRIKSGYMTLDDDEDQKQNEVKVEVKSVAPAIESGKCTNLPIQSLQKPFQPGATPVGFRERFMVWNRIGIVTQFRNTGDFDEEDEASNQSSGGSIEVEFHDSSLHHSLRLSNSSGYSMADLSLTALLLASKGSDDSNLEDLNQDEQHELYDLSRIAVLPLDVGNTNVSDASAEWTANLPPGELCDAVCLVTETIRNRTESPGYAVVATSKRLLRIFTQPSPSTSVTHSTNLHLFQITKLGLPPVSLAGQHTVVMASHPTNPILGVVTCNMIGELEWRVFYLGGIMLGSNRTPAPIWMQSSLSIWQPLPLSPPERLTIGDTSAVRLTWFGFSDTGGLFTCDSNGVVRRLIHGRSQRHPEFHWIPICDTRNMLKQNNRKTDNYFIVGVLESCESLESLSSENKKESKSNAAGFGQLQAIYCKASKWPRVFPRPVVSNLPFRLPLCSLNTDQGDLEENYLQYLVNDDWPVWGPNTNDADEDVLSHLSSLNTKSLTKRKAVLLRLFALAAKLESDWASLAIAHLMPDAATVQLAIRYAGRLRRQNLAHRLAGVALEKERQVSDSVEEDDLDNVPQYSSSKQVSNRYVNNAYSYTSVNDHMNGYSKNSRPVEDSGSHDAVNTSLVSSGTDDTYDDATVGSQHLADSESFSHSALTPSSSRNPFKSMQGPKDSAPRLSAHGTQVLDVWTPKATDPSTKISQKSNVNKTQQNKKRQATGHQRSKVQRSKPADVVDTDQEFTDWFEENRETLEESYPEVSVEELVRIGRSEFLTAKNSKNDLYNDESKSPTTDSKENVPQKFTKRPPSQDDDFSPSVSKKKPSDFGEKASKRLSAFAFSQNS
ncbi:unnamed protein product [Trichobilharzia szidati]|nr:unnamed protein product [Trichobilharzia szidati]